MQIAIVGGGITGLTTALALQKLGIPAQVYERTPQLAEVGAGIWLQPNALKVLDWVGVGDKIRKQGMFLSNAEITHKSLKAVKAIAPHLVQDQKGNQIVSIHRARLQQTLYDALPPDSVHLGAAYEGCTIKSNKIHIQFTNQTTEADVLLAADGIHSSVRQQLFPNSWTRYSGQTCWRGIADIEMPNAFMGKGREAWGNGVRFGFANISPKQVYWFAVANAPENQQDAISSRKKMLLEMYQDFHPLVGKMIDQTPVDKIIRNDISDLKRLHTWHKSNVCLIGDAAHATTPNMGQGAGQGIEDAYYLSNQLAKNGQNITAAFTQFEQQRREKVDYIVNNSWRFGKIAHHNIGRPFMKMMMTLTPSSVILKQMQTVFHVEGLS